MQQRLLIEDFFPIQEVNVEASRERSFAYLPRLYVLHLWWTRKPQIPCRIASLLASLQSMEISEDFIVRLLCALGLEKACNIASPTPRTVLLNILEEYARKKKFDYPVVESVNPDPSRYEELMIKTWGRRPVGGDFMAGGGSIPFEMLRVGYGRVVAGEYNPVAYVILKASLEYPLRYGKKLVVDVERYGRKVLEELKKRVKEYYPPHPKLGQPTEYIWVRYFKCPRCGLEVPATSSFWLDKEKGYALYPEVKDDEVRLHVVRVKPIREYEVGNRKEAEVKVIEEIFKDRVFKTEGYESNGNVYCPRCRASTITGEIAKEQYKEYIEEMEAKGYRGVHRARLVAVVHEDRKYSKPTEEMIEAYQKAMEDLRRNWAELTREELIPLQGIPEGKETLRLFPLGLSKFYRLFNARQLLVHSELVKIIKEVYQEAINDEVRSGKSIDYAREYAKAVITYLTFALGKTLDYNSALTSWNKPRGVIRNTFERHAYAWTWDFVEASNARDDTGYGWCLRNLVKALSGLVKRLSDTNAEAIVVYGDAAETPIRYMSEDGFDVLFTDPPYYGSVQHAELSDFFYVWYRLVFKDLYPEAFSDELTPKSEEAVYNEVRVGKITSRKGEKGRKSEDVYSSIARERYERKLREISEAHYRSLRDGGVLILWFAHRAGEAWIKTIKALIDTGFVITGLWSLRTEMGRSLHIAGKAALRSSMLIVARKLPRAKRRVSEVFEEIKQVVPERVEILDKLNIWGPDLIMAAMAESLRIVSECWPPIDPSGKLEPDEVLEKAINIAVDAAISHVIRAIASDIEGFDIPTRFYIIARRIYGDYVPYDDARRLIISLSGHVPLGDPVDEVVIRTGLGVTEKDIVEGEEVKGVKLLDPWGRVSKRLIFKASKPPIIDYVHKAIVSYEKSSSEALKTLGYIARDACRLLRALLLALPAEIVEDSALVKERAIITSMLSSFCEKGFIPEVILEHKDKIAKQKTLDEFLKR